jgi:hypothetical protein
MQWKGSAMNEKKIVGSVTYTKIEVGYFEKRCGATRAWDRCGRWASAP